MNKENKKNKKTLIALVVIAIAVTIAIIITTVLISLNSGSKNSDIIDNPSNPVEPDKPDDSKPDVPDKPDDNKPDVPGDDTPTLVEVKYGAPLLSYSIGQEFNIDEVVWSDTLKWYATHNGTDFKANKGDIVTAVYGGTVESVKYTTQNGYVITIKQTDGNTAQYMSLSSDILVEEGASVSKGTQIGYVSDSMSNEQNDGAHLHLEITDADGQWIDPMSMLPAATDK